MPDKDRITSLTRAAQTGDDLAFAELVRSYQDIAVAYAAAILRNYHLAEDAVQEAFVEAYRELAAPREPAAFAAWFRTIIFKHCDRMMRRKRHRYEIESSIRRRNWQRIFREFGSHPQDGISIGTGVANDGGRDEQATRRLSANGRISE